MKINYNVTGKDRKAIVTAISQILNAPAKYLGMPTANYEIGGYTVTKTGELIGEDNRQLFADLCEQGFVSETEEFDAEETDAEHTETATEPFGVADGDTLTIELPFGNINSDYNDKKENLRRLIEGKATLIKAALGEDGLGDLPIEFTAENTVKFKWLKASAVIGGENDGDSVISFGTIGDGQSVRTAWTAFLCAAVKFAKKSQRITAKDSGDLGDNPKFDFRVFLVKIGLKGMESKVARKVLLRNLPGSTAFKNEESAAKWKAKNQKGGANTGMNSREEIMADAELIHDVNELLEAEGDGSDE